MHSKENCNKKIAVLFGGCSSEHEVSLQSAYAVVSHMDRKIYTPVLIGITRQGVWYFFDGDIEKIPADTWHNPINCTPAAVLPNPSRHALLKITDRGVETISLAAAFPVLHGKNGEDGTVQGMLALAGIPVVGCGVLSSALCLDKDRTHRLVRAAGVAVPRSYALTPNADIATALSYAEAIGYPLFVKPVKAGSSLGVTKVSGRNELPAAIQSAFAYDDNVIIEEAIAGFEVGCAIMGGETLTTGEVDEIELADGFLDFTEKYTPKTAAVHVPARINKATSRRIKQTAQIIYRTLDCRGLARIDMFLTDSGEIVFNEVNTMPGFTAHSRFPIMMKAAGLSFEQIISTAIEEAMRA